MVGLQVGISSSNQQKEIYSIDPLLSQEMNAASNFFYWLKNNRHTLLFAIDYHETPDK